MDDRAAVSRGFEAGNLAHRRGLLATCQQECPDLNSFRVPGLVQKGPDATAAVIVVEVSGNVYAMHRVFLPFRGQSGRLPLKRTRICPERPEGGEEHVQFGIIGEPQAHDEMRAAERGYHREGAQISDPGCVNAGEAR